MASMISQISGILSAHRALAVTTNSSLSNAAKQSMINVVDLVNLVLSPSIVSELFAKSPSKKHTVNLRDAIKSILLWYIKSSDVDESSIISSEAYFARTNEDLLHALKKHVGLICKDLEGQKLVRYNICLIQINSNLRRYCLCVWRLPTQNHCPRLNTLLSLHYLLKIYPILKLCRISSMIYEGLGLSLSVS